MQLDVLYQNIMKSFEFSVIIPHFPPQNQNRPFYISKNQCFHHNSFSGEIEIAALTDILVDLEALFPTVVASGGSKIV